MTNTVNKYKYLKLKNKMSNIVKKDKYLKTDLIFSEEVLTIIEDSVKINDQVSQTMKDKIIKSLYEDFHWIHSYGDNDLVLE